MSTEYGACVIFGAKVSENFLWDVNQKRQCDHKFESKFCPECGKSAEPETQLVPKDGWDQHRDTFSVLKIVKCRSQHEIIIGCVIGRASFNPCQNPVSTVSGESPYNARCIAEILGVVRPEDVKTYLVMEAT